MSQDRPGSVDGGDNPAEPLVTDKAVPRGADEPGAPRAADPEETDTGRNQGEGLTTPGGVDGGSVSGSVATAEPEPPRPVGST